MFVSKMIKRFIINKLQQELTQPEILILLGPRQVGKTTLLRMLEDYARLRGPFFELCEICAGVSGVDRQTSDK